MPFGFPIAATGAADASCPPRSCPPPLLPSPAPYHLTTWSGHRINWNEFTLPTGAGATHINAFPLLIPILSFNADRLPTAASVYRFVPNCFCMSNDLIVRKWNDIGEYCVVCTWEIYTHEKWSLRETILLYSRPKKKRATFRLFFLFHNCPDVLKHFNVLTHKHFGITHVSAKWSSHNKGPHF